MAAGGVEVKMNLCTKHALPWAGGTCPYCEIVELRSHLAALKQESAEPVATVWVWSNKTTFCVFATRELALKMNTGGASMHVEPIEVPVVGYTKQESAEPVAYVDAGHLREVSNGNEMLIWASPEQDDHKRLEPIYITPTAAIEDFKRRVLEVCDKIGKDDNGYACYAAIQNLPLEEK